MKVVVADPIHPKGIEALKNAGFTVSQPEQPELLSALSDADALIVRSRTKVTKDHLTSVKVVVRAGTGIDNIDLEAAKQKGVIVMNVPGVNAEAVAEHTLVLMFALSKQLMLAHTSMKQGVWNKKALSPVELRGKTLGLIGYGQIGRLVGNKARALGMTLLVHDPFVLEPENATWMEIDDLLREADYVSVHAALTKTTRHLLNGEMIGLMKQSAFLINCSRGPLIDEKALLSALENNQIAGAALDVFAVEGKESSALAFRELDNVILTPHIAGATKETQERVGLLAAQQVIDASQKKYSNVVSLP